uniref:Uncharacterized protein n=1 Tax=Oryzias latipes TaxID=8090 RepID=A0A3P9IEY0_ORYLA
WWGVRAPLQRRPCPRGAVLFLNATIKAFKGYNEEMSSMRLMVLQNRLVLDLLVAQEGGVCKMLNDTCCTFILDNTNEGHSITEALHQLEKVQQAICSRIWKGAAYLCEGKGGGVVGSGNEVNRRTQRSLYGANNVILY